MQSALGPAIGHPLLWTFPSTIIEIKQTAIINAHVFAAMVWNEIFSNFTEKLYSVLLKTERFA